MVLTFYWQLKSPSWPAGGFCSTGSVGSRWMMGLVLFWRLLAWCVPSLFLYFPRIAFILSLLLILLLPHPLFSPQSFQCFGHCVPCTFPPGGQTKCTGGGGHGGRLPPGAWMEEEDGQRERSRPDGRGHVLLGILCLELTQGGTRHY